LNSEGPTLIASLLELKLVAGSNLSPTGARTRTAGLGRCGRGLERTLADNARARLFALFLGSGIGALEAHFATEDPCPVTHDLQAHSWRIDRVRRHSDAIVGDRQPNLSAGTM
jgi:hypothetical protein